jgi:hypothetical protein
MRADEAALEEVYGIEIRPGETRQDGIIGKYCIFEWSDITVGVSDAYCRVGIEASGQPLERIHPMPVIAIRVGEIVPPGKGDSAIPSLVDRFPLRSPKILDLMREAG